MYKRQSSSCLLPPEAVEAAIDAQLQQMEAQLAQQGIPLTQYLQMMGKTTEAFREEVKPYASKPVSYTHLGAADVYRYTGGTFSS